MQVTYYGHACFLVETQGKKILFDPFISPNPKADIDLSDVKCDYILLTHAHQDHTADVEAIYNNNDCQIISNFEITSYYGNRDMKGHPLNQGGKATFDFGTVKYVPAIHSSSFADGTYGGNPGGFVIWNEEGCFYHSGDTSLTMDMKLIPMLCPKLDFAILCIGDNFTMGIEEAVLAAEFIECDRIIGCHYDTFGYIEIDHAAAKKAFSARGKQLHLLSIGDRKDLK